MGLKAEKSELIYLTPLQHIQMRKMLRLLSISCLPPNAMNQLESIKERYEATGRMSKGDFDFVVVTHEEYG